MTFENPYAASSFLSCARAYAKTIADEIRAKISMALAFRDPSKDKDPSSQNTPPATPVQKTTGGTRERSGAQNAFRSHGFMQAIRKCSEP